MSNPLLRFHVLVDWLEGRLEAHLADEVAEAVATSDETTRQTVAWIEEFLGTRTMLPLVTPPPELSRKLRDLFDGLHAPMGSDDWCDAELRHDTRATGTTGFRSSTTHEVAHLIYHGPVADVLLEVSQGAENLVDLGGQFQHPTSHAPLSGAEVAAALGGELVCAARTGDDGRIAFTAVSAGIDELWITYQGSRMRLPIDLVDPS